VNYNTARLVSLLVLTALATTRFYDVYFRRSEKSSLTSEWSLSNMPWLFDTEISNITNTFSEHLDRGHDWKLLFVGNSYTEVNDLPTMVRHIFQEQWIAQVIVKSHYPGGQTFRGHVESALVMNAPKTSGIFVTEGFDPKELRQWLITKPKKWNWVLLQEQSQVPGFWNVTGIPRDYAFSTSLSNSKQLNGMVERIPNAQTMFYMTWGRRNGIVDNSDIGPELYKDYPTMQARITAGYQQYMEATSRKGRPTYMAPVGLVFSRIYKQCQVATKYSNTHEDNPGTDPHSLFYQLYSQDGSHPSLAGSYLAALTIYGSIMGDDPRDVVWKPDLLSAEIASQMRQAVAKTIMDTAFDGTISYPWQESIWKNDAGN